jgi:hypothetical protein
MVGVGPSPNKQKVHRIFFVLRLGVKPRELHRVDMHFTTELHLDMHKTGCGSWISLQRGCLIELGL